MSRETNGSDGLLSARELLLASIILAALLSFLLNGVLCGLANWYAASRIGYGGLFVLNLALYFPALATLAALLAIPISILALPFRRAKTPMLAILLAAITFLATGFPLLRVGHAIRMRGFERQAERGMTLVRAIHAFEEEEGRPPRNLDELVPEHLPSIPKTGMPAYPKWEYVEGKDANEWDHNPWVLYMDCSSGGIDFDMFLYFPKQNYPTEGYGGTLEKIGDWAYVHE